METLSPEKLNKSFSVKIGSGRRANTYTLLLGSMGISLLDGAKPYKSFIYANLVSWDASPTGLALVVGVEKKKVEFITPQGEEIALLITDHARMIAEQYLADQRREEEQQRQEEERRHEQLRQQHQELESQHEQQARERQLHHRQGDRRASQLGSPEHAFRPPPDESQSPASNGAPPAAGHRASVDSFDSELDRIQQDGGGTSDVDEVRVRQDRAQQLAEEATELMQHANRPDDFLPAQTKCESALQLDPENQLAAKTLEHVNREIHMRQDRAQQLAEEAMELMQHANRPDDYRPAQTKCESALQLDPENQLAKGTLEHVNHVLRGEDAEGAGPKVRFAGLKQAAGSQLNKIAPKGMMQGMKFNAAKTGKNVGEWVKHRHDEQTGPRGFHSIGLVKVHAYGGLSMAGSKGVTICAFLGSYSVHSSFARENAEHGSPQWDEALLPISVEEVTETLQIVLYRGDLHKYGHVADGSLKTKLRDDKIIGQVLIPLAHLYPLRRGKSVMEGHYRQIKIRSSSHRDLKPDAALTRDEPGSNAAVARAEGEPEQSELRTAFYKGTGQHHGRLGRGRKIRGEQQEDTIDSSEMGSFSGDSGLQAGGISVKELGEWKHAFSTSEYQREKQQTKEKRTKHLATNTNDDLFRNMVGQRKGRRSLNEDEDDDARSDRMSVKSAPGAYSGSGLRTRHSRNRGASRSVSGLGSDEEESLDSGTSMPVSTPSSNVHAGGGRAGSIGRAVHFAAADDTNSEASFASSEDTGGTGGTGGSGARSRKRPSSPSAASSGIKSDGKVSPATKMLPDVPSALPKPIHQGPGTWYEIFPYCSENSDGQYRTAVDELSGLAMSRPEPRMDLPGHRRTLGYIRLKVELELLSTPYSCYLREPKRSFKNYDEDELSIPRLKHNWLRLKMVLMPNHVIHRARDIAQWDSYTVSGAVLSFWAYLSLMAPFWQYPVFLVLLFGGASATGRHSDRLLEEVVVWEDMADEDPDPFTLKKLGKVKGILLTVQKVLGIVASFGERLHYIFSWTDPIVTYLAIFVTVVMVVVTSMVCYGIYSLAVAIGGRPIWFCLGSIWMLPPRFAVIPWSKIDDWEDFLLEETETEQVLLARKKIRQRRFGKDADLQLEKRLVRGDKPGSKSAGEPTAEPNPGEPEPESESKSTGGSDALPAAANDRGAETSVDSSDPDVQAALKAFVKPNPNDAPPATSVVGMLGNLWARIPDVPVHLSLYLPASLQTLCLFVPSNNCIWCNRCVCRS